MQTHELTPAQLRQRGIEALVQALGALGMVQFLQQFDQGSGDYTRVGVSLCDRTYRPSFLADIPLAEVMIQIKQARA